MDISVINKLKELEDKQANLFEENKKKILQDIETAKKDILNKNEMEIYELESTKHDIVKRAKREAKKEAGDKILEYEKKIEYINKDSSQKINKGVEIIFDEFLEQNV